jgi:hypothetical protein
VGWRVAGGAQGGVATTRLSAEKNLSCRPAKRSGAASHGAPVRMEVEKKGAEGAALPCARSVLIQWWSAAPVRA